MKKENKFKKFLKEKGKLIPLIISFLPYIVILVVAIISMFTGFSFLFNTSYGFEAFLDVIFICGYMGIHFLILPVCWLIQIAYLMGYIFYKANKSKNISLRVVLTVARDMLLIILIIAVIMAIVIET